MYLIINYLVEYLRIFIILQCGDGDGIVCRIHYKKVVETFWILPFAGCPVYGTWESTTFISP